MSQPDSPKFADLPRAVQTHPGLITKAERVQLFELARTHYRGEGLIIDAGTFLGASAVAFAEGIRASGMAAPGFRPIRSYDIAIWYNSMNPYLELPNFDGVFAGQPPRQGDSFAPALKRLLTPYQGLVDLEIGDLIKTAKADQPIEIAFFDCLKTNPRDIAAFQAFAPHFIAGHTVVLQQDYFYESAAFNKIRQEYFAAHFEYLGRTATTAAFLYRTPINPAEFSKDTVSALPLDTQIGLLRQAAMRTTDPKARVHTELAVAEHLVQAGEFARARAELDRQSEIIKGYGPGVLSRRPESIVRALNEELSRLGAAG